MQTSTSIDLPPTEWWAVGNHMDSQGAVFSQDLHCSRQATHIQDKNQISGRKTGYIMCQI